mmetsp:Transcript_157095/g.285983  ORF Transcript_157095/g.285983 Transcript_157095/m.285983 type:complete len:621 (+) Transcript_157095:243-2105(+)
MLEDIPTFRAIETFVRDPAKLRTWSVPFILVIVFVAYVASGIIMCCTGQLPRACVIKSSMGNRIHAMGAGESGGSLALRLHLNPPDLQFVESVLATTPAHVIKKRTRKFVVEWMMATGLYFLDVSFDVAILIGFWQDEYYHFFWLGVSFLVLPPVAVWLFLRGFGLVRIIDLALNISQLGFIYNSLYSLLAVEKNSAEFWQQAGEGGMESPMQAILQSYRILIFATCGMLPQMLCSIGISIFSCANTFAKTDLYGHWDGMLSKQHVRQVLWRCGDVIPRLIGIPIFGYLVRPHGLGKHENGQWILFVFITVDFVAVLLLMRKKAPTYPISVQLFLSAVSMVGQPPMSLPSLKKGKLAFRVLRASSLIIMSVIGFLVSSKAHALELLHYCNFPLVCSAASGLLLWTGMSFVDAYSEYQNRKSKTDNQPQAVAVNDDPDFYAGDDHLLEEEEETNLGAQLVEAAGAGDMILVYLLLLEGASPDSTTDDYTALIKATEKGYLSTVSVLLQYGASANFSDNGYSPLIWAADEGHLAVLQELLRYGADITGGSERTPLHWASESGHVDIVGTLLAKNADIESESCGETPLSLARRRGHTDVVNLILSLGARDNARADDADEMDRE